MPPLEGGGAGGGAVCSGAAGVGHGGPCGAAESGLVSGTEGRLLCMVWACWMLADRMGPAFRPGVQVELVLEHERRLLRGRVFPARRTGRSNCRGGCSATSSSQTCWCRTPARSRCYASSATWAAVCGRRSWLYSPPPAQRGMGARRHRSCESGLKAPNACSTPISIRPEH